MRTIVRTLRRVVGRNSFGPITLLRVTYSDGVKTWNISASGALAMMGNDHQTVREVLEAYKRL